MRIGIVGAGFIGRALARIAVKCGHQVMICNSRGPETLHSAAIALRCATGSTADTAAFGELVVIAVPLKACWTLDPAAFEGKLVVDANNYYPERDGAIPALDRYEATTSELLAHHFRGARIVKCFNAILQEDLEADARPRGASRRRALPLAGDDTEAKGIVSALVDEFGFDPVDAGTLAESWRFERAMPAYCVPLDTGGLLNALASARRGVEVEHGSWRRIPPMPRQSAPAPPRENAHARNEAKSSPHHGFSGRGGQDIVDAQFHLMPEHDVAKALGAMDALGIRCAMLDELWGFDDANEPLPHARLPNGTARPISALALAAAIEHPSRFSFQQRIVRADPQISQWIPILKTTPGCRALRITLLTADERQRFGNGEWDEILKLAQQHELPVCVMAPEASGILIQAAARRFGGLRIVVDHCGWPRTPAQWEEVLSLSNSPNTWLKWSHFHRAFRRFDGAPEATRREFLRAVDAFGPERVLWAGDTSHEESSASWGELLSFVRDESTLSEGDRAWVLARSARTVFDWPA